MVKVVKLRLFLSQNKRFMMWGIISLCLVFALSSCRSESNGGEECQLEIFSLGPTKTNLHPGETVEVVANVSDCGAAANYVWSANNGEVPSGQIPRPSISYTAPNFTGEDTITVQVEDTEGRSDSKQVKVFIVGNGSSEQKTATPEPVKTPTATPATQTLTPSPIPPTPTPEPDNVLEGKVCEAETTSGEDTATFFVSEAVFVALDLDHPSRRVKVNISLEEPVRRVNNITLDIIAGSPTCAATMSPEMLAAFGLLSDLDISIDERPDRRFGISEVPIEIRISQPLDGAIVGPAIPNPSGTYSGIPSDRTLWLVVFVDSNFFPQRGPATILSDTEWLYGTIFFGGTDTGFSVMAVLADDTAAEALRIHTYGSPIPNKLPVGAIVYDVVDVFRE